MVLWFAMDKKNFGTIPKLWNFDLFDLLWKSYRIIPNQMKLKGLELWYTMEKIMLVYRKLLYYTDNYGTLIHYGKKYGTIKEKICYYGEKLWFYEKSYGTIYCHIFCQAGYQKLYRAWDS